MCYVGWWNYLVVESLQHCFSEHCKLAFLVLFFSNSSSALSAVSFISQPSFFTLKLLPEPRFGTINFGAEGLVSEKLALGHVFVSHALYHINPKSSAALIRVNPEFL